MKFLVFITPGELRAYDVERKEYIGIDDSTSFKYCRNTDIENFCACIADQLGEEKFADLAAAVTIVNCGANLMYVDKLYNALEGCREKNVLNVERILPVIAFGKGIKKEQQLCFQVFGQYYLIETNENNEISVKGIDKLQAEVVELQPDDFMPIYRFVADGQCGEELEKLKQRMSDSEKENKVYKDQEQAELKKLREIEEARKRFKVGDIIKLGEWHSNPIEWQVLEVKDGKALLLSKYALACRKYHNSKVNITWENCDLRKWLNGEFFQKVFKGDVAKCVVESHVPAHYNPDYGTDSGNDTKDKVFLLNIEEVLQYFKTDEDRICKPLFFLKSEGAWIGYNGAAVWWLRSPGYYANRATYVYFGGSINSRGHSVNDVRYVVRPALWVDLSKL